MLQDIGGLILVSFCWGFTNPFIKLGTKGLDAITHKHKHKHFLILKYYEYYYLITRWQFVLPLAINLSGSFWYYYTLGETSEFLLYISFSFH